MVRIVLDAGHGGNDPGAVANGLREKDLTLSIVKHIGRMLGDYVGVEVHYTRTDDRFLELSERAAIANKLHADYFISVHINAGGGTGFESYIYNGSVNSATIAYQNVIHAEVMKAIGGVQDRGKKQANFAVLRETNMPAILTENLFIDNVYDATKLKSEQFLLKIAHGHVQGLVKAFGFKKKTTQSLEGWVKENSKWYFYKNGKKQTGWIKDKGKWYFLDSNGVMQTGWIKDEGKWYYLNKDGSMATGWVKDKDKWYYLGSDGAMSTGLIQYKGKWYYLKKNGEMLSDTTVTIDKDGAIHFE